MFRFYSRKRDNRILILARDMATLGEPQGDFRNYRISAVAESEDSDEDLEVIFGRRWRLYWATPLQDLQYTEARLKQYAMHLRGALQEENVGRVEASVTALPELRPDDEVPVPLQISVEAIDGENKRQCLYAGIMLSWTKPRRPSEQKNWVHLPLLLCRGQMKTVESVHLTLHSLLNCNIKQLTFANEHMLWILGLAAHFHDEEFNQLHLRFLAPDLGDNNVLDFTILMAVLKDHWRSIHGTETMYITYDQINSLREECYKMLEETYGVNLRMLNLTRIKCKDLSVSVKGHVKFSREFAKLLLTFVHDIGYMQESGITGKLDQSKRHRGEEK
ncbi:uncharacterized protein LOC126109831 isoform X2 [Schistocerca cancellata]|uniref:uncharacterized protein LOC126109831 isoform X2 n=1 Tax=Schistocerca cancellata TaxID=274614 RepID=UPI00211806F6|nr:uncharacterized protein LOC126109831 isoform X2 [Schistocerca cancellata]